MTEVEELRAEIARLRRMMGMDAVLRVKFELATMVRAGLGFERAGGGCALRISQQEFSERVGTCRETASRILADLRRKGLLGQSRQNGFIEVLPELMSLPEVEK